MHDRAPHPMLSHCAVRLLGHPGVTLWVGEEIAGSALPVGLRMLRKIARLLRHALLPLGIPMPPIEHLVSRMLSLGPELALAVADRTLGRTVPISLEDPFDGGAARLPEWQTLLDQSHRGLPTYCHRAIVALVASGRVARIVTPNHDELLETAARRLGVSLPVVDPGVGDPIPPPSASGYLCKVHGTVSRPAGWPVDLHRLHAGNNQAWLEGMRDCMHGQPLLVLGYRGPDPFDLWPLLTQTEPSGLLWANEHAGPVQVKRAEPGRHPLPSTADLADRLLQRQGGWRVWGRLTLVLEQICQAVGLSVPGPSPDEDQTGLRDLDELFWPEGEDPPLSPSLEPLARKLSGSWIGALALMIWLDLFPPEVLNHLGQLRESLEKKLHLNAERAWLRVLLGHSGRPLVEDAFHRFFLGLPITPPDSQSRARLARAIAAFDLSPFGPGERPLSEEEARVERAELQFVLTGSPTHLPSPAQVMEEMASITHVERWHRLKAAGAVTRGQWSVATQELAKAQTHGGESGSPLMKLRAQLALAALLTRLLRQNESAALVGALQALARREKTLAREVITSANAAELAGQLALRTFEAVLQGYAVQLPSFQPSLRPVAESFVVLVRSVQGSQTDTWLFDRSQVSGRLYRYLPEVESILNEIIVNHFS